LVILSIETGLKIIPNELIVLGIGNIGKYPLISVRQEPKSSIYEL